MRSQAFLYLVHRFLEQPELAAADFADGLNKLSASQLLVLDRTDCSTENADTAEELAFGIRMKILREDFLEKYRAEESLAASSSNAKGISIAIEWCKFDPESQVELVRRFWTETHPQQVVCWYQAACPKESGQKSKSSLACRPRRRAPSL